MTARTADVVVVGAGIVGAACAHRLSTLGLRVVVLDRGRPNGEGSGASAANVHAQGIHTRRPGQAVPVDVRRLMPLQRAARVRWDDVTAELGRPVGLVASGGFMVAETAEQEADLRRKHEWEAAAGIVTELVDGDAARRELPLLGPGVRAASWCDADAHADPALVVPAYLAAAAQAGAEVVPFSAVHALRPVGGTWTVAAGTTDWSAPTVVDAAGPWMGQVAELAGVPLQLAPLAIQMLRLAAGGERLPCLVQHVGEGFSVKEDAAGRVVVGGGWPARPWQLDQRPEVDDASTRGSVAQLRRVLPTLADRPVEAVWPGPLGATPDEMPVAGRLLPGLLALGGTYSFTLAPLWADVAAALVTGAPPPVDLTDLDPGRLVRSTGAPELERTCG